MIVKIKTLKEFHNWVQKDVIPLLTVKTLVLLEGPMGAGKTEFVKTTIEHLNLGVVQSPTFAFHHVYAKDSNGLRAHHVDLYRLKSQEDLESIGFWDLFQDERNIIFVEWANRISEDSWPWGWSILKIKIEKGQEQERQIELTKLN